MTRTIALAALLALGCTTAAPIRCADLGGSPRAVLSTCAPTDAEALEGLAWIDEAGIGWVPTCDEALVEVKCNAQGRFTSINAGPTAACVTPDAVPTCASGAAPRCVPVVCPEL